MMALLAILFASAALFSALRVQGAVLAANPDTSLGFVLPTSCNDTCKPFYSYNEACNVVGTDSCICSDAGADALKVCFECGVNSNEAGVVNVTRAQAIADNLIDHCKEAKAPVKSITIQKTTPANAGAASAGVAVSRVLAVVMLGAAILSVVV